MAMGVTTLHPSVKDHLEYLYRENWEWTRVKVGRYFCEWDMTRQDGARRGNSSSCGYGKNNAVWGIKAGGPESGPLLYDGLLPALYVCHEHYLAMTGARANPARPGDVARRDWCGALTALIASVEHSGLDVTEFVRKYRASVDRIIMRDAPHYPDRWEVA